jgi:hypothetical protein
MAIFDTSAIEVNVEVFTLTQLVPSLAKMKKDVKVILTVYGYGGQGGSGGGGGGGAKGEVLVITDAAVWAADGVPLNYIYEEGAGGKGEGSQVATVGKNGDPSILWASDQKKKLCEFLGGEGGGGGTEWDKVRAKPVDGGAGGKAGPLGGDGGAGGYGNSHQKGGQGSNGTHSKSSVGEGGDGGEGGGHPEVPNGQTKGGGGGGGGGGEGTGGAGSSLTANAMPGIRGGGGGGGHGWSDSTGGRSWGAAGGLGYVRIISVTTSG